MIEKLINKFDFLNPNISWEIICGLILVWGLVVGATLSSLFSQKISWEKKLLWTIAIVLVPLLGVLCYLPFSLKEELYPLIGFWRAPRK